MAIRRLCVYENAATGKVRAELRGEAAEPRPKKGEQIFAADYVEVSAFPEATLADAWEALGIPDETNAARLAKKVRAYGAARRAAGVDRDDDEKPEPWDRDDVQGGREARTELASAVAKVWGKKLGKKQAAALGVKLVEAEAEKNAPRVVVVKAGDIDAIDITPKRFTGKTNALARRPR
jgi:hypothetical protein